MNGEEKIYAFFFFIFSENVAKKALIQIQRK